MNEIEQRLHELERLGLGRRTAADQRTQGPHRAARRQARAAAVLEQLPRAGRPPRGPRSAAADAAMRWGVGAGASRLVSGTMTIHRRLEERLAEFKRRPRRACCSDPGYLANIGVVGALAGRGDVVFSDELNHASIIDGCRLSRAEVFVYRHRDLEHLAVGAATQARREPARGADRDRQRVLDGRGRRAAGGDRRARRVATAPRVLVDEAHATGALGPGGRGAVAEAGLEDEVDVVIGTLGKALGSYGAYACLRRGRWPRYRQRRPDVHLLDRAAAAGGRRRAGRARAARASARGASRRCAPTPAPLRAELEREGFDAGRRGPRSCR